MLRIDGRNISKHPLDADAIGYRKIGTVLAAEVQHDGVVFTPEGEMQFHAGDYIITDNPVTHAWPCKKEVFERTYVLVAVDE